MEDLKWINARDMYRPSAPIEPPIDHIISQIVGFKVYVSDPRILKTVVKFKRKKQGDEDTPDNFLENPQFIKEIKEVFTQQL